MNLATLLCKVSTVVLISCGCVLGTNFAQSGKQVTISFPTPKNIPLDFASDIILPETPITNFQPAERLPDSFVVTESTTERSVAGDQIPNEANLPKLIADDWSPPSGTIGPVATPRPDDSDAPAPFVPEKDKTQFVVPVPKQDSTRKPLPPSVLVVSRGITGHYAEQGWFPFDATVPRQPPPSLGESSSQKVPGNFPFFPSPVKPDMVFQPKVFSQWIPPPVPQSNLPRSVPKNVPVVIIQNVSLPFPVQPPATVINAPLPIEPKPSIFQTLEYFPKQIPFSVPKTFVFPGPPVSETPVTNPPVEETPSPPEVTTSTPTTTMPPPPSPPPPPPPPYFILQSKKEVASIFPPFFIPTTPVRFIPPQTVRPIYFTDDPQFAKPIPPTQYKTFSPTINGWIPGPNILKSQFPSPNVWYAEPPVYKQKPAETPLVEETPPSTVKGTQTIPPLSSDFWIIKGPANAVPKANIPPIPLSTPIALMQKPKVIVPVRGNVFPQVLDPEVVPTFPGIQAPYSIYLAPINSSSFYRFSKNVQSPLPLQRLYFARPKQPSSSFYPTYNSEPPSQLDSFPLSYTYPVMTYPFISQPSQEVQVRPSRNKENCTTPASQDPNLKPSPDSFYVQPSQPSAPVYLPMPQTSYSFVPIRPSIPDVPLAVFQPIPTGDSRPPPAIETPVSQEAEKENRNDQESVPAEEQLPGSPDRSAADNVVIAPVFPFINNPISFPKPVTTNENIKRPPYFFRYGQSDSQGTLQYRTEEADPDGMLKGSYGYRGADGIFRKVDYTADGGRYRSVVRASEPRFPLPQSTDLVIKDSDNFFAGSSQEKNTAESEP